MRKIVFLSAMLLAFSATFAQPGPDEFRNKKEKMDAMKIGFITEKLELSTEEAQRFWPVYNELDKKIEDIRKAGMEKMFALRKEGKTLDDLSEDDLQKMMVNRLNNDEKIAQLKKQYHENFVKVIGIRKTAALYQAEMDFSREMMKHARNGKPGEKGKPTEKK